MPSNYRPKDPPPDQTGGLYKLLQQARPQQKENANEHSATPSSQSRLDQRCKDHCLINAQPQKQQANISPQHVWQGCKVDSHAQNRSAVGQPDCKILVSPKKYLIDKHNKRFIVIPLDREAQNLNDSYLAQLVEEVHNKDVHCCYPFTERKEESFIRSQNPFTGQFSFTEAKQDNGSKTNKWPMPSPQFNQQQQSS